MLRNNKSRGQNRKHSAACCHAALCSWCSPQPSSPKLEMCDRRRLLIVKKKRQRDGLVWVDDVPAAATHEAAGMARKKRGRHRVFFLALLVVCRLQPLAEQASSTVCVHRRRRPNRRPIKTQPPSQGPRQGEKKRNTFWLVCSNRSAGLSCSGDGLHPADAKRGNAGRPSLCGA